MSLSEYIKDLNETEKEQVYAMLLSFESIPEELLIDIICSSTNKETIELALKHKNFSSHTWQKFLSRKEFGGITAQELLDKAYKIIQETEKEQVYTMLLGFESTTEELLIDIICSSTNKETIELALKHKKFSIHTWQKLLSRKEFVGITAQELLDKAYKIIQETEDREICSDMCMSIASSPITTIERLEDILNFINKKRDEYVLETKRKITKFRQWTDSDNEYFRINFFEKYKQFIYTLVLISVHPNGNIDLSNKVFAILGEIDKLEEDKTCGKILASKNFRAFDIFLDEKFGRVDKYHKKIYSDLTLLQFNNLPCMANGIILDILERCKFFKDESKNSTLIEPDNKKIILDFVFDDKTTDELIKKYY